MQLNLIKRSEAVNPVLSIQVYHSDSPLNNSVIQIKTRGGKGSDANTRNANAKKKNIIRLATDYFNFIHCAHKDKR